MVGYISYDRRMNAEEHYSLYQFYLSLEKEQVSYEDFRITEQLIECYNSTPMSKKQMIAEKIKTDPQYLALIPKFEANPWTVEKPVLWKDRKKTDYYIEQLKKSHAFEVYVDWLFRTQGIDIGLYYGKDQQYHQGETQIGMEIKCDMRSVETGNYYIEYQERMYNNTQWIDSGILKQDHTRFYLLGTINHFVIFEREWLMEYYDRLVVKKERLPDAKLVREQAHLTSKGFILFPKASQKGNIPIDIFIRDYLKRTQI